MCSAKVWWTSDKAFHDGTVESYDAATGTHGIRFAASASCPVLSALRQSEASVQSVDLSQEPYQLTGAYRTADAAAADTGRARWVHNRVTSGIIK
jgi:hypothetical protein